jgi:hypothetical protein
MIDFVDKYKRKQNLFWFHLKGVFLFFTFRMGNPAMPIDRYDVRGLLSDLSKHEAKNVEPNLKYSDYLSPGDTLVINKKIKVFYKLSLVNQLLKLMYLHLERHIFGLT